jgi:hypothetical protein
MIRIIKRDHLLFDVKTNLMLVLITIGSILSIVTCIQSRYVLSFIGGAFSYSLALRIIHLRLTMNDTITLQMGNYLKKMDQLTLRINYLRCTIYGTLVQIDRQLFISK